MAGWTQVAAAVAPSIIGGLFGSRTAKAGQQVSQEAINAANEMYGRSYFRPYTVTTSMGNVGYNPMTGQQYSMMTPGYQNVVNQALAGAGGITGQLANFVPEDRAAEVYKEQLALLEPTFQQQEQRLKSDLFGSGRLGMKLAGEGAGAGAGAGMVNPDVFGFQAARGQTLAQLAAGSRQQAMQEATQMAQLATSMLNMGLGVNQAENQLIALGVDAETARSAAATAAANVRLAPYGAATTAATQAGTNQMGLLAGATRGLLSQPGLFTQQPTQDSGFRFYNNPGTSFPTNLGPSLNQPWSAS